MVRCSADRNAASASAPAYLSSGALRLARSVCTCPTSLAARLLRKSVPGRTPGSREGAHRRRRVLVERQEVIGDLHRRRRGGGQAGQQASEPDRKRRRRKIPELGRAATGYQRPAGRHVCVRVAHVPSACGTRVAIGYGYGEYVVVGVVVVEGIGALTTAAPLAETAYHLPPKATLPSPFV